MMMLQNKLYNLMIGSEFSHYDDNLLSGILMAVL